MGQETRPLQNNINKRLNLSVEASVFALPGFTARADYRHAVRNSSCFTKVKFHPLSEMQNLSSVHLPGFPSI